MSDDRLGQILDAAYQCFTRHGVRRTTMDDIAAEVGMSRPAVYQYVRNKEDAFRRLAVHLLDEAGDQAEVAASSELPPAERITAICEAKLALTLRLWHEAPAHAAELIGEHSRLFSGLDTAFCDRLRDLIVTQLPGQAEAPEVAELALALTRGLEADLSDPVRPLLRLRRGLALLLAGLDLQQASSAPPSQEDPV